MTLPKGGCFYYLMTRFCLVSGFRNKEKSGSQPASLDHVQDRKALTLKAHQSESHLPIGRCGGVSGEEVVGGAALGALELFLPKQAPGFEESTRSAWREVGRASGCGTLSLKLYASEHVKSHNQPSKWARLASFCSWGN